MQDLSPFTYLSYASADVEQVIYNGATDYLRVDALESAVNVDLEVSPSGVVTVPFTGLYLVTVNASFEQNDQGTRFGWIMVNPDLALMQSIKAPTFPKFKKAVAEAHKAKYPERVSRVGAPRASFFFYGECVAFPMATMPQTINCSALLRLNANDSIFAFLFQDSGDNLSILSDGSFVPTIQVVKLGG